MQNDNSQLVEVPDHLDLWSFQPREFVDHLLKHGESWQVDPAQGDELDWNEEDSQFRPAYHWIIEKMRERGIKSPCTHDSKYPIWAWWWWFGPTCKENLKHANRRARKGEGSALLHLRVPRELVLISEFTAFHSVINQWHCSTSESECDAFDEKLEEAGYKLGSQLPADHPLRAAMEKSWERILDVNMPDDGYHFGPIKERTFQATMFGIRREHVVSAEWLPPKGRKYNLL